ncbi:mitochondrial amidoxime-reducing component 1-like [Homarus americanus]|uniref:mitochondrial amidoxime-reducing component 1-like n=1 Tax=Homarus americanus TaxID=6706 RepID=UPI001C45C9C7|nr:mitochondrial amidoxime-reducing component 1-like [Homarus americanus]
MLDKKTSVGVGVGVGVTALTGWWAWKYYTSTRLPDKWEEVGEVYQLSIFPLKSGRGVSVKEAQATTHGLAHHTLQDRVLMAVTAEGTLLPGRPSGRLRRVMTKIEGHVATLEAEGHTPITVDLEEITKERRIIRTKIMGQPVQGVDCGDEVAEWLTKMINEGQMKVRLLYKGNVAEEREALNAEKFKFKQFRKTDKVYFANNTAYMMTTTASLENLNKCLDTPITMTQIRPNIEIVGTAPHDEDDWAFVKIGQTIFRKLKPCQRCMRMTMNPSTGDLHPKSEPLRTLRTYRKITEPPVMVKAWPDKVIFGANFGIDVTGTIRVGDKVLVARASQYPKFMGY